MLVPLTLDLLQETNSNQSYETQRHDPRNVQCCQTKYRVESRI